MAERKTVEELKKELERVIDSCNMEVMVKAIQIMHAAKALRQKKNDEEAAILKMAQYSELKTETDGCDDQEGVKLKMAEEKLETGCDDQEGVESGLNMAENAAGQKEEQLETETDGCDDQEALKLKNTAVVESGLKMAGQKEEQLETGCDDQEGVESGLKMAENVAGQKDEQLETETDGCDDQEALKLKNTAVVESGLKMAGQKEEQLETGCDDLEVALRLKESGQASDHEIGYISKEKAEQELESRLSKLQPWFIREEIGVMRELRLLIEGCPYVRDVFGRHKRPINKLLNQSSVQTSSYCPSLQLEMVTVVFLVSDLDHCKSMIVQECSSTMPFLFWCLISVSEEIRRLAIKAIHNLSAENSNRKIIGESGAIRPLTDFIKQGDPEAVRYACKAIGYLCRENVENRKVAVSQGAVIAVMNRIKRRICLDEMLATLEVLSRDKRAIAELEKNNRMLQSLFVILREEKKERCVFIIHKMCHGSVENMRKISEVENARHTLDIVVCNATTTMVREKAIEILSWLD